MNGSKVQVGVKKLPMHLQSSQNRVFIKGGKIVNDDRMFTADVYIEDGIIKQVGTQLTIPGGVRTIDASGKLVIPGGIDTNTCMEFPVMGVYSSDDFYSGTKAALAGGTTTISISLLEAYEKRKELADPKVCCDYSFHVIITHFDDNISRDMETLVKDKGVASFRVFMSNSNGAILDDSELFDIFHKCQELGAIVQVHASNGRLIKILEDKMFNDGITGPEGFLYSHPEAAEVEATNRAIMLANSVRCPLYVLQVMSDKVASEISEARLRGNIVTGETITAALSTNGSHYKHDSWRHAAGYVVNHPLKADKSVPTKLLHFASSGVLECIASNHCVFKSEQKAIGKDDFRKIPPGVNGVEDRLSILWETGVVNGVIDPCKFVAITSTNAAKIFNLYPRKGRIDIGSDADIVIWDGEATRTISAKSNHENVDFNIFEGMQCRGMPVYVISGGRMILDEGELRVTQGIGRYLPMAPFPSYLYERIKRLNALQHFKPVKRESYAGLVAGDAAQPQAFNTQNGTNKQQEISQEEDLPRTRLPTRAGGRNMQESSFSLSGVQYDDDRPIRTSVRTKQPPGGASNALW